MTRPPRPPQPAWHPRSAPPDGPDRLYTVTGGRSRVGPHAFDVATLVVTEQRPVPGMQSEHARILRRCERPTAVVEVAAELGLPISVVKILLGDLLAAGRITARHPRFAVQAQSPDLDTLEQVLRGLRRL
ncbi:DUF742 domain-containing protein [Kitasatospora sp. NBC_01287]|uniref:DUF742 domain-containing protein n=1 Tax=Kitasatospora sp. NBC_01287 TaxID=2903573 RepID=UPI00225B62AC|nr:DUF742 domain-containing protein [Kitasatospora sp. NBC_01287]MCX4746492.1 DUF742 domain-containing protein [Kitasatospora sp. NBC_01287]